MERAEGNESGHRQVQVGQSRSAAFDRLRRVKVGDEKEVDSVSNSEFGMRPSTGSGGTKSERKDESRGGRAGDGAAVEAADVAESGRVELTRKGRLMARIPLDPRLSRMLLEAEKEGCTPEMAVIAAALSIQDARERPAEKTKEADRMHALFDDPESDFITLLNIWHRYHAHWKQVKSNNQMKRFCREHFISFKRMREWRDVHSQIVSIMAEHKIGKLGSWEAGKPGGGRKEPGKLAFDRLMRDKGGKKEAGKQSGQAADRSSKFEGGKFAREISAEKYAALHKSVLSGFLSNIAQQKEKNFFRAARGRDVMIFPGSGLFDKARSWVVAAEVVETSRVFARTVAHIDSSWLEDIGRDLCKYTYLNPHWERNRGEVVALEQVTLFGLIIVPERKVSYGRINPEDASDIFIQSALISGDVRKPFAFMKHNQKLIDGIRDIENRFRRRDILVAEQELFSFYRERLPAICDIRKLSRYLKQKGNDRFLRMNRDDLILYDPDESAKAQFPDRLELAGQPFNCAYVFEPGQKDDGITVRIPAAIAPTVPPEAVDWLVPGIYPEKIEVLIKALPKAYRKKLVPVKDTVEIICREMQKTDSSLISTLGRFIYRRFGVDIPAAAWSAENLPDHLKMRISITAPDGKELRAGRDPSLLQQTTAGENISDEFEALRRKWEKDSLTSWDFGDLPEHISESGKTRNKWLAYPALEKDPKSDKAVNLRLFLQRDKARAAHRTGVLSLYSIQFAKDLKFLKRQLVLPANMSAPADYFGGRKQIEKRLYQHYVQTLFSQDIRSQQEFYDYAEKTWPTIISGGRDLLESVLPVLTAYHEARSRINRLQSGSRVNPKIQTFFRQLVDELVRLIPENFIELYDKQRLVHLERYARALLIRAQRAPLDFEKDQAKAAEVQKHMDGLNRLLKTLSSSASEEKRLALEAYFWMLEEYKVSVFAQELKTAMPVSAKRLRDKLGEIERMV